MIARVQRLDHSVDCCHPGGKGQPTHGALEFGNTILERFAGRVPGARIFISLVGADALLAVGRAQVDRGHDRPSLRIGRLAGVDCQRFKSVGMAHRPLQMAPVYGCEYVSYAIL